MGRKRGYFEFNCKTGLQASSSHARVLIYESSGLLDLSKYFHSTEMSNPSIANKKGLLLSTLKLVSLETVRNFQTSFINIEI